MKKKLKNKKKKNSQNQKKKADKKKLSLYPLKFDEALRVLLTIPPELKRKSQKKEY